MTLLPQIPVLLISGTVGVGKTSVADELYETLKAQAKPVALINVDELGYAQPRPADDPFNGGLKLKNVSAVWPNYYEAGVRALIIPDVIEGEGDSKRYMQAIVNAQVFIIRLDATLPIIEERIRSRHLGGSIDWHLRRASELKHTLETNACEDAVIDTSYKTISEVVAEVTELWQDFKEM